MFLTNKGCYGNTFHLVFGAQVRQMKVCSHVERVQSKKDHSDQRVNAFIALVWGKHWGQISQSLSVNHEQAMNAQVFEFSYYSKFSFWNIAKYT